MSEKAPRYDSSIHAWVCDGIDGQFETPEEALAKASEEGYGLDIEEALRELGRLGKQMYRYDEDLQLTKALLLAHRKRSLGEAKADLVVAQTELRAMGLHIKRLERELLQLRIRVNVP